MGTQIEYGTSNIDRRNPLTGEEVTSYYRNHQRSLYPSSDIDMFFGLVKRGIDDYYASYNVPIEEQFKLYPSFPKDLREEDLGRGFNIITYRLLSRKPGPKTRNAVGGRRKAPFVFEGGQDPVYAGYKLEETVHWRSNLVEFYLQTTSYPIAEEGVLWFESVFMPSITGSLQAYGIGHVHFEQRLADTTERVYENLVYVRSLLYEIETQTIQTKSLKTLDSLTHSYEL